MFDIETEVQRHRERLEALIDLGDLSKDLGEKDQEFANSLMSQFVPTGTLSVKQWDWVFKLRDKVKMAEPVYGNFNAINVMFRLAGEHLKAPKVRLLSKENTFVQLTFHPDTKVIDIHRDGWQGHGRRKFIGTISNDMIVPHNASLLTDDVRMVIQELSLDPVGTARAMAGKLGACMYCAKRLSDARSKELGYGPICAKHYGLPR